MSILMSNSLTEKINLDSEINSEENTQPRFGQVNIHWDDETMLACEMLSVVVLPGGNLGSISLLTLGAPLFFILGGKKIASIDFCDIGYNYVMEKWSSVTVTKAPDSYVLEINLENKSE